MTDKQKKHNKQQKDKQPIFPKFNPFVGRKLESLPDEKDNGKGKIKVAVLLRMGKYLFRHRFLVTLAFILMISSNLLALAGPKLAGKAIGAIGDGNVPVDFNGVFYYSAFMLIIYAISALLSYLLAILLIHLSQKIVYSMRREVFEHLTVLPVGYFDLHQTGDIISRISYDIDTVNASLSNDLLQICASIITVVGSLIMMITIAPILLTVFVITVPISIFFTKFKTKRIRPYFRRRSGKLGMLNGYAEEMLSGHRTVKAYHREDIIVERFDVRNTDASDAYFDADFFGAVIGPSVNFINNLSLSLITMLGGIFYMLTMSAAALPAIFVISLEDITSFILYSRKFAGPINEFANILSELQSACAAAERVFRLLDEAPEVPDVTDAVEITDVSGNVKLENVRFGYIPGKTIIHDLSFEVKPGQTIAIVGPTGAGKTTIINLLMRFYDVDSGKIMLDGNEIRSLTRSSLRRAYTMVLQDTWLFGGTIYDNITYGKEGATLDDVKRVAKAARIDGYIDTLPDGYNTILSDDGVNISKGQKQLITIARAMLADAPMLILDEATSNVDSRTEIKIQEAMNELMIGKTCFVIAHRLSTIKNADMILVFKDGNVIEHGTHDELLAENGFYASLYNSQFN